MHAQIKYILLRIYKTPTLAGMKCKLAKVGIKSCRFAKKIFGLWAPLATICVCSCKHNSSWVVTSMHAQIKYILLQIYKTPTLAGMKCKLAKVGIKSCRFAKKIFSLWAPLGTICVCSCKHNSSWVVTSMHAQMKHIF